MTLLETREAKTRTATPVVVATVYVNACCPCSRKALDVLEAAQERHPNLAVDVVDLATVPELAEQYDALAPVVLIDGKVRFRGLVNPVLLDRLVAAGT